MANKRQKKKQQKRIEEEKKNNQNVLDTIIENTTDEIKKFEKEINDVEIKEDNNEKNIEEIKTEEDFSNKLDNILSSTTEPEIEKDEEKQKKLSSTAEKIAEEYKDTEKFTMKDITKMMRSSGLSYRQIMQQMKAIGKATEEYAATQGDDFDKKEFLKQQMEQRLQK